eukprot:13676390-Ditylum_brightwellii.AAC.1
MFDGLGMNDENKKRNVLKRREITREVHTKSLALLMYLGALFAQIFSLSRIMYVTKQSCTLQAAAICYMAQSTPSDMTKCPLTSTGVSSKIMAVG